MTKGNSVQKGTKRNGDASKAILSGQIELSKFPDAFIAITAVGTIQYGNKAYEALVGFNMSEVVGKQYTKFVLSADLAKVADFIDSLSTVGATSDFVHRLPNQDGTVKYISWSAYWSQEEKLVYAVGRDVTLYINSQQKQMAREHLFQTLIDNSFDLLAFTDEGGNYLYVSDSLNKLFGYESNALLGTNCFDYIHPDDVPRIMDQFRTLLDHDKKINVPPYRFRSATGEWLWMEAIVTNQLQNPEIKGVVVSVRDIHQQVETARKLKEMQTLQALMEGEEKERSRIARDLHDEISGMIAAAKMHFSSLSTEANNLSSCKSYLQGMQLLEAAALQVRRTSHNLMPEVLLENGLTEALSRYCKNVSNDVLTFDFISVGTIARSSSNFELSLYRIAQELIGNIIKHSKANKALVQLSQQDNTLSLSIEDNGVGFSNTATSTGTGLDSVKRRVKAMGGIIEIQTKAGEGTSVYMEFGQ